MPALNSLNGREEEDKRGRGQRNPDGSGRAATKSLLSPQPAAAAAAEDPTAGKICLDSSNVGTNQEASGSKGYLHNDNDQFAFCFCGSSPSDTHSNSWGRKRKEGPRSLFVYTPTW